MSSVGFGSKGETPPRMWRKLLLMLVCNVQNRNTSTYVEKTMTLAYGSKQYGETPPRMWRKQNDEN